MKKSWLKKKGIFARRALRCSTLRDVLLGMFLVIMISLPALAAKQQPPEADISGPSYIKIGQPAVFSGSNSLPGDDREITEYRWSVKDESGKKLDVKVLGAGDQVQFIPTQTGKYTVELSVFDGVESKPVSISTQAMVETLRNVTIRLKVPENTPKGEQLYIAGNNPQLGNYEPFAVPMKEVAKNVWEFQGQFELGTGIAYEYTRGGWGTKGRDENGSFVKKDLEITEDRLVINDVIDNWGRVEEEPSFPRLPYLSWSKDPRTTMTISYGSESADADTIYYGTVGNFDKLEKTNTGTEKFVTLVNLKPGTKYNYRIGKTGNVYTFTTAPAANKTVPFHFVVCGDSQSGNNADVRPLVAEAIIKEDPAFVISTGDLTNDGWQINQWQSDFFDTYSMVLPYVPFMATLGNHEQESDLFSYYFRYPDAEKWYSFVYGNAMFVSVDSEANILPGSPQYSFIEEKLRNSQQSWKFVYFHHSPYSTSTGHGSNLLAREYLSPLFEKYGVDIVFSGHNHCYERTRRITQNKVDEKNGVTYITNGGSGGSLVEFKAESSLSEEEKAWVLVRDVDNHFISISIDGKKLSLTAKTPDGKILDTFEIKK